MQQSYTMVKKEVEVELDEQQLASVEHYLRDKYGDTIPVITGVNLVKY